MRVSTARSLRSRETQRGREALPQEDDEEEEVQERPLRRGGPLLVPGELEVKPHQVVFARAWPFWGNSSFELLA